MKPGPRHQALVILGATVRKVRRAKSPEGTRAGDFVYVSGQVPVDGQGPTYVESGNVDKVNFTARDVSAGVALVQTRVNNDRFLGYVDGKLVASATIRIHEVEHFVGLDTDGDGVPDAVKVSVTKHDFSCPA